MVHVNVKTVGSEEPNRHEYPHTSIRYQNGPTRLLVGLKKSGPTNAMDELDRTYRWDQVVWYEVVE